MAYGNEKNREQMLERPLPHSPEAERAILGAIMLDNGLISQAIEELKEDDFYVPSHRRIFSTMCALFVRGSEIDPLIVAEELKPSGGLASVGGQTFISSLTYGLPHFTNIYEYSRIVRDHATMRNLVKAANRIISEALEGADPANIVVDHAEQYIFAIADARHRQGFTQIKGVAENVMEHAQRISGRNEALTGLTTGFYDLDNMTSGLQASDLIIVAARPSMGKCLTAQSLIALADGSVTTIEEIFQRKSARLLTLKDDFTFALTEPCDFIDDGLKPVYKVTTKLGREIETTLTHPFLTINGWQKLSEIKVGEKIAVPRVVNLFGTETARECEIKLLAYLIGDGCLTHSAPVFTVGKPALRDDFVNAVNEFGGVETVPANSANRTFALRIRKIGGKKRGPNSLTLWLRELGLGGCDSHAKFIPAHIFRLQRPLVALFLNRLFATDGWASVLATGQAQIGFASVSETLIRQVQHLLLRFGIIARLKKRSVKYKNERRPAWQLDITDALAIKTFAQEIGIYGKEDALAAVLQTLAQRRYQTNCDLIPLAIWPRLAATKGAESWAAVARRAGIKSDNLHIGQRAPTRERLRVLAKALDDSYLTQLADSEIYWDEISAIEPAGVKQVYDLTIPDTHNFVANDICVHNTSLCLSVAQNAALMGQALVAIFSLEMSKEALVMRMLCSEARVDAHRFRSGSVNDEEWGRLAEGLARLSEAKIFIDDTPGITILEMRAKLRRLAAEHKQLDLIIVDYLQLMAGGKRSESRQQEVSQISRDLKGLAKEFNVPLIALSQLSRAPETRTDHRPQLSDLRDSGCLAGETLVTLADTGAQVPIRDLVGQSGFGVWALNEKTMRLERAVVSRAFATGVQPVFRLQTKLGREIRATANHKFYTFNGWQRLDELRVGERLALPRHIPAPYAQTLTDAELALLGHLIGDGCTLPRHVIQYTTREKDLAETVAALASEVFGDEVAPRINPERQWYQVYLTSTRRHTHGVRSAIAEWLGKMGIWGLRSYEKHVPAQVFAQPAEAVGLFLRHLWATDGCIGFKPVTKGVYPAVYYASSSERLARDVQSLLLRLSINAKLYCVPQRGKGRNQFHVVVGGRENIMCFMSAVGAVGARRSTKREEIMTYLAQTKDAPKRDTIPFKLWYPCVERTAHALGQSVAQTIKPRASVLYAQSSLTRASASALAERLGSERLRQLAESDIYWDEIKGIVPDGTSDVYDLTVDGLHNFVSVDIIAHNSIEQDSDVVGFIYREEQYNRTDENEGKAEFIIAKQRNGPTGSVNMIFLKQFTRFENVWRD